LPPLFGSTTKGAGRPDSDVDLLVEFEPDASPSLLTMAEIERALASAQRTEGGFAHCAGSEPLFSRGRRARRMSPDDRVRLRHIADGLASTVRFTRGRKRKDLDGDEMLVFALMHALQIVGEAASRISAETRV
jgi:hypothetical protein